jgi:hypothetical protein
MKRILGAMVVLTMFGCAQQVAPTGGPKDETPPKVIAESPANLSTNFSSNQIVISFDEFIELKSPLEQVVISPPLPKPPSYLLKQRSLVIKFDQMLNPNTTYTINFGESIADNNEGNILQNYVYVFSTGAHLDSMEVKGRLVDAITGDGEKGALVMLYRSDEDSLPRTVLPDYFGRTSDDGDFHIKHVADQPYRIFALKDENTNYRFDVGTEKIGFLDSLITPYTAASSASTDSASSTDSLTVLKKQGGSTVPSYQITMFVEEDTAQFLKKSYCEHYGKLVFVYNRPVSKFDIEIEGHTAKRQWLLKDLNASRDSIIVWTTDVVPDTMRLLVDVGSGSRDTVEMTMKPRSDEIEVAGRAMGKGARRKTMEKLALTYTTLPRKGQAPRPEGSLSVIWRHPIMGTDLSRVKLYEDSLRVKFDIRSTDPALRKFDMVYPWKKGSNYRVVILDSAFMDIFNLWNDTVEVEFVGTDKNIFGELSLNVSSKPKQSLLIELSGGSNAPIAVKKVSDKGIVQFEELEPGKYTLSVITDVNSNGKWDSGSYAEKKQPEPIKVIQAGIEVRANWTMELEWNPDAPK